MLFDGAAPAVVDKATDTRTGKEDAAVQITNVSITDAENDNQTVTLTAQHGTLTVNTPGALQITNNGGAALTLRGSLSDINNALNGMTFQGDADYNGMAGFILETNDGTSTATSTINVNLSPVNDAPRFTGTPIVPDVNEGGSVQFAAAVNSGQGFTAAQLGLTEVDNSQQQVIFKITSVADHGVLTLNGNQLTSGSTFSAADLGNLIYVHNGSQVTTPGGVRDGFTVNIDDGAGGLITNQRIEVNVLPVNQLPTVTGQITVIEGEQNVSLTTNGVLLPGIINTTRGMIGVTDPDQTGSYTYQLAGLPTHGQLYYDGVAITDSNFVITDLSKLTYSHDGTEPTYSTDSFQLVVTDDGGGTGTPASRTATIQLTILPNDNDPVLAHHETQTLVTTAPLVITSAMLQVVDTDSMDTTITYTVTGVPDTQYGYFMLSGGRLDVGSTFTQDDINHGRVSYVTRQTSATQRTDTLEFTVKDGDVRYYPTVRDGGIYTDATGTTLQKNTFSVIVPPGVGAGGTLPAVPDVSTGPQFTGTAHIDVQEGNDPSLNTVTITSAALQANGTAANTTPANLTYRLLTLPTDGAVLLNGQVLNQFDSFTQDDVDNGRVQFRSLGGEDFIQSFEFTISDGTIVTATHTFSISVTPENDTPTATLGNQTPAVSEGLSVVIDNRHIVLSDSDRQGDLPDASTPYANTNALSFTIEGNVAHGKLFLDGVEIGVGAVVTAAQLNGGKLTYVHDGSENFSDFFELRPMDDQGVPDSGTATNNQSSKGALLRVDIIINPINDAPVYDSKVEATGPNALYEGGSVVIHGDAGQGGPVYLKYTDADNTDIQRQYRIITATAHGNLMRNGAVLGVGSVFTQAELDSGVVTYVHDGSDTRTDSFQYVVSDGDWTSNEATQVKQGDPITAATFNFEIKPVNDAPTVTAPPNPIKVGGDTAAENPIPGFSVADSDLSVGDGNDFLQVTVRLLDAAGNAFSAGDYTAGGNIQFVIGGATGVTVLSHNGVGDYLVFQGTRAQINAALAALQVVFPDQRNNQYTVQVIADDRVRDGSGNLVPNAANGGDANQPGSLGGTPTAIPTDVIDGYQTAIATSLKGNVSTASVVLLVSQSDEPPTLTAPTSATVSEDVATFIGGGFVVADAESTALGLPISVTLSVAGGNGTLGIGGNGGQTSFSINGRTVTIVGDNTGTMTLTGRADDIQALLNDPTSGLTYRSPANANGDLNGGDPGDVTVNVSLAQGDAAVGENTGGDYAPTDSIAITLDPTNDAPTVTAGTGTIVAGQANVDYPVTGVVVTDPDIPDGTTTDTGETSFVQVTVRLLDQNGNPLAVGAYDGITLSSGDASGLVQIVGGRDGNEQALVIQGDIAAVNQYLAQLRIKFDASVANVDKAYKIDVIVDDRLRDAAGALNGSGQANGGPNLNGGSTGTVNVPTTAIDPYGAIPAGLTNDVAHATRDLFVSGVNDPAQIDATNVVVNETNGVVSLNGHVSVTDSDSIDTNGDPGSNLTATITIDKGTFTSAGAAGLGGTVTGLGTNQIVITGATLAQINARLDALQITTPSSDGVGGSVDWNGTFNLSIVVNDGGNSGQRPGSLTGDTNNPTANPGDYDYADGSSAELLTRRDITVTVNAVNDAPTRTDGTPVSLPAVSEDAGATPPGATVQSLFGGKFQDVRDDVTNGSTHNNFAGIAITANGATAAQGTWQYSTDGGVTWQAIPAVSVDHAFVLATTDMLRFSPAADYAGTPGNLDARLVDTSSPLTSGQSVDLTGTNSGGTTQYSDSSNNVTLTTSVTAVNDAPTLSGPGSIITREDVATGTNTGSTVDAIVGGQYSDGRDNSTGIPGGANTVTGFQGIVILGNSADATTQGKWQYSTSPGVWVDVPVGADLSGGTAIYLPKDASLRFQPVADYHGAPPALTISAVDGSGGARTTVETGLTISATGGTTAYSTTTTIGATVTAVNDQPDFTGLDSGTPVAVKGGAAVRLDSDGVVTAKDIDLDVPGGNWAGVTLTVQRQGGANANDVFGWASGSGITVAGTTLLLNGSAIGAVTGGTGTLTVTFNNSVDAATAGTVIGAVTYRNTDTATTASPNVTIDFTLNDQNNNVAGGGVAGSGQNQGEGGRLFDLHSVTVQIDTPPVAAALPDKVAVDTDTVTIDTATGFTDPDGDTLTYTVGGLPPSLSIDPATGQITGTLDHSDSQGGAGGVYTVTVTATDSHGGASSQTFTLTVSNPAPDAQDDTGTTNSDTPISGDVIAGANPAQADSDPDGDTLTVSKVGNDATKVGQPVAGSNGGRFTLNADGTYSFDPNDEFNDVPQGATRTTSITYEISDGEGGTDTATLTITVVGLNAAPTVDATLPDRVGVDNTPITIPTASGFTDIDTGDTLTYSASGLPAGLVIDPTTGEISGTIDHSASQGGSGGTSGGVYTITVTATDTHGDKVSQDFTLTVSNPTPAAQDDFGQTDSSTPTGGNVIVGATPGEADSDPDGDTLAVSQVGGDAANVGKPVTGDHGGRFIIHPDGTYTFDPSGDFADLDVGQTRTTSITYQVSDGEGGTATAVLTITVNGLNDPPVAQPDRNQTDAETPTSGNVIIGADGSQADHDPEGEAITLVAVNGDGANIGKAVAGSDGGLFTLNADGSYSFDPNGDFAGLAQGQTATTQVTYTIVDGHGHTASTTVTVTVVGTNDAPTADTPIPDRTDVDAQDGIAVDVSHAFQDIDGDTLTYTAAGLPPGMAIDPATGMIRGTMDRSGSQGGAGGAYTVTVTASDGHGGSVSRSFVWQVSNPGPQASPDSGTTPNDTPLNGNVLPNDSDVDGDTLKVEQFSVAGVAGSYAAGETVTIPNVGTLTLNADGSYTFVAVERYEGDVPLVTYHISDGEGGTATSTLQIVVTQTNGVLPQPVSWTPQGAAGMRGTLAETLQTLRYGEAGDGDTDGDDDTGGVLHIEYWALRPEVIRISRGPSPALFVTHAVRESQMAATLPQEPARIQSTLIAERLAMPHDLHVLRAVDVSQRLSERLDAGLAAERFADTPGGNPLFNDFDPLTHLGHAAGHAAARPDANRDGRPAAAPQGETTGHAPSFTRQLHQAAGAARPPGASTPARTSTPRQ
ncbi:cadherin-like domain-containing protein [Bordetella flabilis]|uniref:Cadherin domain-containing protein n=1 Tax=Bordetella flabilis TaxID=463014 RepID=A0A193G9H7_9BORD|nr:cadherin-like domain-containing protein [Bordetella flabilis]ANN76131.1 hypothetical protein BAU07_02450 [Bordetella flabilis]